MDPIVSPLTALEPDDIGPEVENLHTVLARLDLAADIPPEETGPRRLGPATVQAVRRLFELAGLGENPTGIVPEAAARRLNNFLVDRRILALVEGTAVDGAGRPAAGYLVRIHDLQNLDGTAAAETTVEMAGRWRTYYDPLFYRQARPGVIHRTDAMVLVARAFDSGGIEAAHSEPTPNPEGRIRIDLVIQGEVRRPPGEGERRVRGWLENRAGTRLPGFKVEVFDRDIGPLIPEQRLGEPVSDPTGAFAVLYNVSAVAPGDAEPPIADIVFRITDPNGRTLDRFQVLRQPVDDDPAITAELPVPTVELPRGIPARTDELVRIVLSDTAAPVGPSEFEVLMAALRPLLGQRSPAVMDEASSHDVSFAARETGQDGARIADLVMAFRLAEGPLQGVPPAVLYALARTLDLHDPAAIAARRIEDIAAALTTATPLLIPNSGQAPTAQAAEVRRIAAGAALAAPVGAAGSLGDAIASHLPDAADRTALMEAFTNHPGSPSEFWGDWAAANPGKPLAAIQLSLQLAAATSANTSLAAAIQAAYPEAKSLRALTLELDGPRVTTLMAGAPPDLEPGETAEAGARRYAEGVVGLLDAAHPTAAVARLAKSWAAETPEAVSPEAADLMRQVVLHTDYELGSGGLAELAEAQADILFQGQNDPQIRTRALADAQRIERLYNISTGPKSLTLLTTIPGLDGTPFKGAYDIASLGKDTFLARFADQPPEIMTALSAVHETAQVTAEASASLVMAALQESRDPTIAAVKPKARTRPIPNWAQLFGTERLTECDESRAWNGPCAYLCQVLHFLHYRCAPNTAKISPYEVLCGNPAKGIPGIRPDLVHIKLSSENTNTTLPAIDLVNEVLESCLVFGSSLATPPNEPSPGVTADELAAAPEHVQAKAYETLSKAVFPISLPFDLTAAEARPYLADAGASRERLIALYRPADADALAAERLRLTTLDRAILSGTPTERLETARLFGLVPEGPHPEVGWAARIDPTLPVASSLLGLTVTELLALTATRFVSGAWPAADRALIARLPLDVASFKVLRDAAFADPAEDVKAALDWLDITITELKAVSDRNSALLPRTIVADPPNATKLEDMRLVHLDGTPLAEADWLRRHRLARLSQRTGIAIRDLDLALTSLGALDKINDADLRSLGALKSLGEALHLDWPSLVGLFGDLPAALNERLFVRSGVARADPAFQLDSEGRIPATPGQTIPDHAATLAAAFDLQPPEVVGLAEARGLTALNAVSVAALWREACLAAALDIAPGDLVLLQDLTGESPLTDPIAALSFVAVAQELKPVLADALRFSGARPAPEDAATLKGVQEALTAALAGVTAEADRRRITLETLGGGLSIPPELLAVFVGNEPTPDLARLQRLSLLTKTFALKLPDVLMLVATKALPDAEADAKTLMAAFRKVQAYVAFKKDRQPAALALALATLASVDDAGWSNRVADAIAACRPPRQGGTDAGVLSDRKATAADVKAILGLPLPWPPALVPQADPVSAFAWIDARLAVVAASRTSASTLADLAKGGAEAGPALTLLKRGVQARYEPATWLQVARRLNEPVRQARRDALVAYFKHQKGLTSDEALFSELLMDAGPHPDVLTSRISNAIRTIQLFVHSVRLGLWNHAGRPVAERVDPGQINPEWDLYLHSFRMTQANLEVLANPYLYMAPDLRDDKTPIFQEIEGFLRQNDPTPENVKQACLTYLERVGEVSNLEICGSFLQEDFTPEEAFRFKSVLHVFGRSRGGAKRAYYYRRLNSYQNWQEWTPWEPVKVDIQAVERDRSTTRSADVASKPEPGVHLLPVMWRRRLHIFWPSFVRKIQTSDEAPAINLKTGASKSEPPQPYWEVKLCWSRLDNGVWSPRQISSDYYETFSLLGVVDA